MEMLSVEEIKKGCEFAEGFEWCNGWIHHGRFKFSINSIPKCRNIDLRFIETVYPLFVTRVIEGIDKAYTSNEIEYRVLYNHLGKEYIVDYKGSGNLLGVVGFLIEVRHDQAKTKAIKYILEKL